MRLTDPYVTHAEDGYFVCGWCGEDVKSLDFIVRPVKRRRGDRTAWHYDCEDPAARELHEIANRDRFEVSLGHSEKRRVDEYYRRHAAKARRK